MRVLLVTESYGWSGGAAQTLALAQGLRNRGHDVLLACEPGGALHTKARTAHIPLFPMRIRGDADPIAIAQIVKAVHSHAIDICHAQHPKAHAVALMAAYFFPRRSKLVVTRRVSFPVGTHFFSRVKYRAARIERIVAVSEGVRDVLVKGGVNPQRVVVIHSGVDPQNFQRADEAAIARLRMDLRLEPHRPVVMKVANYGPWKGQHILLQAVALLIKSGTRVELVLAGRGVEGPELAEQAERLGITPYCHFLGFRDDVADLLSLATVSVNVATEGEGLSGALRESLLLGTPVIASSVAGNTEIVKAGITGRLVPPSNVHALSEALRWAITHQPEARTMAQKGQALVQREFTTDQMVSKTETLYLSLLQP